MRRVAFGVLAWLLVLLACGGAQRAPLVLVYTETPTSAEPNAPQDMPNPSLMEHLLPFLKELRKVQVVEYRPDLPIVQQMAQSRGWDAQALKSPSQVMLGQIARALGASYLLIARYENGAVANQLEYSATVWQIGRRAPVWEADGVQQVAVRTGGDPLEPTLRSLARTLVMRLDAELWANLPTLPEQPTSSAPKPPEPPSPNRFTDPQQEAETLLKEGRLLEALLPLRLLVQRDPTNEATRLSLIELYHQLGMVSTALAEAERALELLPESEPLLLAWVRLVQAEETPDLAIARLRQAVQTNPDALALRLKLFDLYLEVGDLPNAEQTLLPVFGVNHPGVLVRRYLLQGATRQLEAPLPQAVALEADTLALWLKVIEGAMTDISNELLDLRRRANAPRPDWNILRKQGDQLVARTRQLEQWVQHASAEAEAMAIVQRVRFACQLLGQSAHAMARYLLERSSDEDEQASLLRVEALRELESAQRAYKEQKP